MAKHPNDERPIVPGNHLPSSDDVTEGGKAPSPTEGGHGHPKPAASRADAEGNPSGGTSTATQGKAEKDHAGAANAGKRQSHKD